MASSKIKPENFFAAIGVLQEEAKAAHNAAVEGILESNNTKRQVEDLLSIIGYNKERDNVLIGSFIRMRENIDSLQSQIDGLGQSILKLENSRENKLNVYEAILRHDRNIGGKSRGVESGQKKGVSSPLKPPGGLSPEKRTERFNERIDKLRDRAAKTDDPEGAAVAKKKLEEVYGVDAKAPKGPGLVSRGLSSLVGAVSDREETPGKGDTKTPMSEVLSNALGSAKTDDGQHDKSGNWFTKLLGGSTLLPRLLISNLMTGMGGIMNVAGNIGEWGKKGIDAISGGIKNVTGAIGGGIKNVKGAIGGGLKNISNFGKNFMGGAKDLAGNVGEGFKNVTGNIGGALGGMKDKAGGWIKGLFGGNKDKNENIDPEKIDPAISPDSSDVKPRNAGVTEPPPPPSPNLNTVKLPDELQDLRGVPNPRVDYQMRVHMVEATLPINPYALELLDSAISNGIN